MVGFTAAAVKCLDGESGWLVPALLDYSPRAPVAVLTL